MTRAILLAPLLASCTWGITDIAYHGPVCGGVPAELRFGDGKARTAFEMTLKCPEGTELTLSTQESTVEGQQFAAETVQRSFDTINTLIDRLGPLWTGPRLELPE